MLAEEFEFPEDRVLAETGRGATSRSQVQELSASSWSRSFFSRNARERARVGDRKARGEPPSGSPSVLHSFGGFSPRERIRKAPEPSGEVGRAPKPRGVNRLRSSPTAQRVVDGDRVHRRAGDDAGVPFAEADDAHRNEVILDVAARKRTIVDRVACTIEDVFDLNRRSRRRPMTRKIESFASTRASISARSTAERSRRRSWRSKWSRAERRPIVRVGHSKNPALG